MTTLLFFFDTLYHRLRQNTLLWVRPLMVIGVLFASAYMGRGGSLKYLVMLAGLGAVVVFDAWPQFGLVVIILGSLVIPFSIGTGSESSLNITILLVALLLGLWQLDAWVRRDVRFARSRTIVPLFALIIVVFLSFLAGQLAWFMTTPAPIRAQIGGAALYVLSAGAFLLVGHQIHDVRWLERMTWAFLIVGGLFIMTRAVPGLRHFGTYFQLGVTSGSMFWTWLVALTFSQMMFNRKLRLHWRFALGALLALTLYVNLITARDWTSGWLPGLVAMVVTLWVGRPRLGFLASLVGAGGIVLNLQKVMSVVMVGDNEYSMMTRMAAWQIMFELARVSPFLGLGPANYYWYTPLFQILGYRVNFNSHNNYVDILAQTGLIGLACLVWFFVELGVMAWKLHKQVTEGFEYAYVVGALGGLAGTVVAGMLGDWIVPFVYNVGMSGFRGSALAWMFLGGLLALEQITMHRRQADESK